MEGLQVGEQFLSLNIGGMKAMLRVNKNKKNPKQPDYTGIIQIAAWKQTKKAKEEQVNNQGGF